MHRGRSSPSSELVAWDAMAAAMVTLVKTMTYRGDPLEEWSNSYHLDAAPASRADWVTLVIALATLEKTCYHSGNTITKALVYDDSDNPATYSLDAVTDAFHFAGTASVSSAWWMAGDQAATVGIDTGLNGLSGKPIWLRKYYHGGVLVTSTPDSLASGYITALSTFAGGLVSTAIVTGIHFADKAGRRPDGPVRVDPYSTTRTLKRRGKRPTP
jgi:hypothetical protein